jgi:Fic family protein
MPRLLSPNLLEMVRAELAAFPEGCAIEDLSTELANWASRRSLQRRLAQWVASGQLRAVGMKKGRKYLLPIVYGGRKAGAAAAIAESSGFDAPGLQEGHPSISTAAREVRALIRRPLFDRPSVGYRRAFLDEYQPNQTAYLSDPVRGYLHQLGSPRQTQRPAGTFARHILDRLLIDLSWASSRLEGNTYSLLDTERLIRDGQAAAGKNAEETQMILNHKSAIELLVNSAEDIGVNRFTLCNLHALLAENLLAHRRDAGRVRTNAVGVTGTMYIPTAIPQLIEEMFEVLLAKAAAILDPYEQALFLMVQMPYLQPFIDVNKRTSRLAANIPLVKLNRVPLSFIGVPARAYTEGMLAVYEFNRVELIRDLFVWAYERSCEKYLTVRDSLPEPDAFRLQYRAALREAIESIIKGGERPTVEVIREYAKDLASPSDRQRFCEVALQDLADLHEGNIARYGLRPSEYRAWRSKQA